MNMNSTTTTSSKMRGGSLPSVPTWTHHQRRNSGFVKRTATGAWPGERRREEKHHHHVLRRRRLTPCFAFEEELVTSSIDAAAGAAGAVGEAVTSAAAGAVGAEAVTSAAEAAGAVGEAVTSAAAAGGIGAEGVTSAAEAAGAVGEAVTSAAAGAVGAEAVTSLVAPSVDAAVSAAAAGGVGAEAVTSAAAATAAATAAAATAASTSPALGTFGGDNGSYWASLGLVIMTAPGLWSLVKRAPKASVKGITFEVPGPAEGQSLDAVASTIATYFTKYNYKIVDTGEVITFQGTYEANRGQGIALTFYVFLGLASISLVLSTIYSEVGNWWYALLLLTPGSYSYYMRNGTRTEEAKVKMVTSDDEKTTDIILRCDKEEIERFAKETGFIEKGKVKVKGILEDTPLMQSSGNSGSEAKGFGLKK